jgi:hypothetical protein
MVLNDLALIGVWKSTPADKVGLPVAAYRAP